LNPILRGEPTLFRTVGFRHSFHKGTQFPFGRRHHGHEVCWRKHFTSLGNATVSAQFLNSHVTRVPYRPSPVGNSFFYRDSSLSQNAASRGQSSLRELLGSWMVGNPVAQL